MINVTSVKTITATMDSSGNAQAQITARDISDSLSDVLAERLTLSSNTIAEIKMEVRASSNASQLTIKMPVSSLKEIAAKENTRISLSTEFGDIQFDNDMLNELIRQSDGQEIAVKISVLNDTDISDIPNADQYSRGIYDLGLQSGGNGITNFGNSKVTVAIPYQLASGEKASGVHAYYINKDGKASVLLNSSYDAKKKSVVFETNHFSCYAIGYDENAINQVFKDVNANNWAADAIGYTAGKGLLQGVSETSFAPQAPMTRGMFVTVLSRLSRKDISGETGTFKDVKVDQWYTNSVNWASNAGIVEGYANNLFQPDQMVSREQMAVFLYRYAKWSGYDVTIPTGAGISKFSDSGTVSPWAEDAVVWSVDRGLLSGASAGLLDPKGQATRAQVAAIAQRFLEKIVPSLTTVSTSSSGTSASSKNSSGSGSANKYSTKPSGEAYITVNGSGLNNTIYLTYADLNSMDKVKITYTGRNKENNNKRQYLNYTGVNLATILNAAGWNGTGKTMKVICSDGYTKKYELSEIMEEYVSFVDDSDTQGYWVPAIVALLDEDTFRLVFGQEATDTDTTMSFNMQGWANYLQSIEID